MMRTPIENEIIEKLGLIKSLASSDETYTVQERTTSSQYPEIIVYVGGEYLAEFSVPDYPLDPKDENIQIAGKSQHDFEVFRLYENSPSSFTWKDRSGNEANFTQMVLLFLKKARSQL